jgi:hypothetical protein
LDVHEYSTTNDNTFQIEMYFDGTLVISYLEVSITDGLAGLGAGEGWDPDFLESDLSNMGDCVPPDCNENGIPDWDDIAGGTSADCNGNEIPDECDIADGLLHDADGNGVADECEVASPAVAGEGPRYVAVTALPGDSEVPVALRVTGDASDPQVSCVLQYVQSDGSLGDTAVYRTPVEWGTVHLCGESIIPGCGYDVRAVLASGFLTGSGSSSTWTWGDVDNSGSVNVSDILLIIGGFQGDYTNTTLEAVDIEPCAPNGMINVDDILGSIGAFQGVSYIDRGCTMPCG